MSAASEAPSTIALVGNPNAGKTTLFNALTGANQRTGNYAGVTVELKFGETYSPMDGSSASSISPVATPSTRMRRMKKSPSMPSPESFPEPPSLISSSASSMPRTSSATSSSPSRSSNSAFPACSR